MFSFEVNRVLRKEGPLILVQQLNCRLAVPGTFELFWGSQYWSAQKVTVQVLGGSNDVSSTTVEAWTYVKPHEKARLFWTTVSPRAVAASSGTSCSGGGRLVAPSPLELWTIWQNNMEPFRRQFEQLALEQNWPDGVGGMRSSALEGFDVLRVDVFSPNIDKCVLETVDTWQWREAEAVHEQFKLLVKELKDIVAEAERATLEVETTFFRGHAGNLVCVLDALEESITKAKQWLGETENSGAWWSHDEIGKVLVTDVGAKLADVRAAWTSGADDVVLRKADSELRGEVWTLATQVSNRYCWGHF